MKKGLGSKNGLGWLCVGLLAWAGAMQGQVPGQRVTLDAARIVAGESKSIDWPLRDTRIGSIVSVVSSPEIPFPIRVDLGSDGGGPLRLTVPPATPPGEYDLQITAEASGGRAFVANLSVTVRAVTVTRSPIGRPPVILLNGFQLICTDTGSFETDSTGTFGQMWPYLLADSAPVLFFNNCAYGAITIEQLAGQLGAYISGLVYTDGTPVTQVDLVAHSMGGLIVRAYLSGLQPGDGTFLPAANPRVRKAVFIATPHFGSFQAGVFGVQEPEMVLGGPLLWDLATWNQKHDDLRGVDAIAVIGNAGSYYQPAGLDDGVVSLTSASLSFSQADQRTRIIPYCHIDPGLYIFGFGVKCFSPPYGIADINSTSHQTWQIVHSFLAGTADWSAIGHSPSQDAYLSQYGGLLFTEATASGAEVTLTQGSFATSFVLTSSLSGDGFVYNEFVKGTGNITSPTAGAFACGPVTEPAGYTSAIRCRPSPQISSVGPLLPNVPGWIVQSGATITIGGVGFGQTRCSTCQVTVYPSSPPAVTLTVSSWSDTAITALLPSFTGFAVIVVQAATGQDSINIMASPPPASVTIQTNPTGLQFSLDGGPSQTAPQTFSLFTGSTHSVSVASPQQGAAAGTQYVFSSWSDAGAASQSFTVNASGTLTATFQTLYQLTTSAFPAAGGSVTPISGGYFAAGSVVPISASPNTGYTFTGWSGNVASSSTASATVTMSAPETVTASFSAILPVSLTIQTSPSGLQFSIDGGTALTAPQTLSLIKGSMHTITAATPQPGAAGIQYVFTGWSDGGAASHSITASASGTLAVTFQTQYQLTLSASPAAGGTVTPASGTFYNSGAAVPVVATPNAGYMFTGWTGSVANSTAPSTTVSMSAPETVTANFASTAPTINAGGIVPLYSSVPTIQPGSWISIYGSNLANTSAVWTGNFPTSLGGVNVMIDNKPGYLWLVSPGQINLQAPDDSATGPVNVTVTTPNGTVSSTVTLGAFGPSFSLLSAKYAAGVILTSNGSGAYGGGSYDLLGPSGAFSFNTRPVKTGETLELYGVGFGPTNPSVPAGTAYSGAAPTANTVTVTIGGVPATVLFSGITTTGLYQFNVVVPSAGAGDQLLEASVNGVQTPAGVYVTLQ